MFVIRVKLAQGGPGGGNFCIHKSFYIRSPFWQGIRDEANKREGGEENASSSAGQSARLFDEIDSRHLTSPELIKSRIIKLLKMSENGLRHCHNLLVAIVCSHRFPLTGSLIAICRVSPNQQKEIDDFLPPVYVS